MSDEHFYKDMLFCSHCDHAIGKADYDQAHFPLDITCPRCGSSWWYEWGSVRNRERWEAWVRGEIKGQPPAPPEEESE